MGDIQKDHIPYFQADISGIMTEIDRAWYRKLFGEFFVEDLEFVDVDEGATDVKSIAFETRGGSNYFMYNVPDVLENVIEVDKSTNEEEIVQIIDENKRKVSVKRGNTYYVVIWDYGDVVVRISEELFKKAKEVYKRKLMKLGL